jgi:hypothetical protein
MDMGSFLYGIDKQHRNLKNRHTAITAVSSLAFVHWIADQVRNNVVSLGHTARDAVSSLASVLWIADQVRNDVVSLGHTARDAVSSLALVLWIADQVRNDVGLLKKLRAQPCVTS